MKKTLYIILGFVMLGLGLLGVLLPVLPTTPFLLVASSCFGAGSERFNHWFTQLNVHKKYLTPFLNDRSMTLKGKLQLLLPVSTMLILTIIVINHVWIRVFLVFVLAAKYIYFFTKIETKGINKQSNETFFEV